MTDQPEWHAKWVGLVIANLFGNEEERRHLYRTKKDGTVEAKRLITVTEGLLICVDISDRYAVDGVVETTGWVCWPSMVVPATDARTARRRVQPDTIGISQHEAV